MSNVSLSLEEAYEAGIVVQSHAHGNKFSYGESLGNEYFWINGYEREPPATIKIRRSQHTKAWLKAQILFWGRAKPSELPKTLPLKDHMYAMLDAEDIAHRDFLPPIPFPRKIFNRLKRRYIKAQAGPQTQPKSVPNFKRRAGRLPTPSEEQHHIKRSASESPSHSGPKRRRTQSPEPVTRSTSLSLVENQPSANESPSHSAPKQRRTPSPEPVTRSTSLSLVENQPSANESPSHSAPKQRRTPSPEPVTRSISLSLVENQPSANESPSHSAPKQRRTQSPEPVTRSTSLSLVNNQPSANLSSMDWAASIDSGPTTSANPATTTKEQNIIPLDDRPALSPIWKEKMQQVETFAAKQRLARPAGSYIVKCDVIEKMFPAQEGKLIMNIIYDEPLASKRGIFEAHFDFGLFTGAMRLGPDLSSIAEYCIKDVRPTEYPEYWRLKELCSVTNENIQRDSATDESAANLATSPPKFAFHYRAEDRKELFMRPDELWASDGSLSFNDTNCMSFDGFMDIPMISDKALAIQGFKIRKKPYAPHHDCWSPHQIPRTKYGSSWKEI